MNKSSSNIAIVCPSMCGKGAVANVAFHQAQELAKYLRVTLVSDGFPEEDLNGIHPLLLKPWRFDFMRRFAHVPNEIAFALAACRALTSLHSKNPVSMVICHGHPVATLAAIPLKKELGIPYALVTHGDISDRPKGTYDARLTWFYCRMTPPAYRNADLVVALSPYMKSLAIKGGARPESVKVIPNGIDPADIGLEGAIQGPKAYTGRLELLYVGRLAVEKGVDVLIDAAALLEARNVSFRLRIAGSGLEEVDLRSQVSRLHLEHKVHFLGPKLRKELGLLYRSSDIVCVPSRSDPLPTVVLEAMAAGVAVVGTETGGIPFMINPDDTGLIVPVGDPVAFADALGRFGSNLELLRHMGEAGRERVAKYFSWLEIGKLFVAAIKRP